MEYSICKKLWHILLSCNNEEQREVFFQWVKRIKVPERTVCKLKSDYENRIFFLSRAKELSKECVNVGDNCKG